MSNKLEVNGHEEVDVLTAIMEEMEAITPKPEEKHKSFEEFKNDSVDSKKVPDAVDAKMWFSFLKRDPVKPGKLFPSIPTDERYYDFTNINVGQALIFNQVKIKGEQERKGSQKDADDLKEVLSNIGFNVQVYNDNTVDEIKEKLNKGLFSNFVQSKKLLFV